MFYLCRVPWNDICCDLMLQVSLEAPNLSTWTKKRVKAAATHLPPTAVAQALHDGVDLRLKHLSQLGAVLVDSGGLAVVQPGVVEHEPDVLDVLPRLFVLTRVQLPLDGGQVHGVLHNVKVVLNRQVEVRKGTFWSMGGRRSVTGIVRTVDVREPGGTKVRREEGAGGTMLLSAVETKVHVQTERHDNFCPPALCFAPKVPDCMRAAARPPRHNCPVLCC